MDQNGDVFAPKATYMGTKDITYTAQFTKTAKPDHGSGDPTEPSGAFLTGIAPQTSVKTLNDSGYTVYDGKKEITSGYVGTGMTAVGGSSSHTAGHGGADYTTATGTFVRVGTVAVDKSVIPLGTRMLNPLTGAKAQGAAFSTVINPGISSEVTLDLNDAFLRTHSAHSREMAFCVNSLRGRISNSLPYSVFSRFRRGI